MMIKQQAWWRSLAFAGLSALALSGCGSDGNDGDDGLDGQPGTVNQQLINTTTIQTKITSASFGEEGILTIHFNATDANGVALEGLKDIDIAGVSVGRVGDEDEIGATDVEGQAKPVWLPYYTKSKGVVEGNALYAGTDYFAGIAFNGSINCVDCLTANGDGAYTLVTKGHKPDGTEYAQAFNTNGLYDVKTDVINGVYLTVKVRDEQANEIRFDDGGYLNSASYYYWIPDTETVVDYPKITIFDGACENCHRPEHQGNLGAMKHPGKHTTIESCGFCHADFNRYVNEDDSGSVTGIAGVSDGSIRGLVHRIHNHSYAIGATYPQTPSNCRACHTGAGDQDLDSATCRQCHNNVDSPVPDFHWNDSTNQHVEPYVNCVNCHKDGFIRGAVSGHFFENDAFNANNLLRVLFESMQIADDGLSITVTFKVVEINLQGEPVGVVKLSQIDPRPYQYGGFNSAIVLNGVKSDNFLVNYQKVGINNFTQLANGSIQAVIVDESVASAEADTRFKVAELIGEDITIALSSQLRVCYVGQAQYADCVVHSEQYLDDSQTAELVTNDTQFFEQDGTKLARGVTPRPQHVKLDNCRACHTVAIKHRYSRDIDGCASCHNGTRDLRGKGASNLPFIVHSQHIVRRDNGELFFKKNDCQVCHGESGFSLSIIANTPDVQPVAYGTTDGERLNADNEQLFVSPIAGACISCHQFPTMMTDSTINHINQNGGVIAYTAYESSDANGNSVTEYSYGVTKAEYEAANPSESCAVCHDDEQLMEVHANRQDNQN